MADANVKLTVVGSINLDLIAATERLPTPGETVGDGVLASQPGGKGGNQAAAAARLGATVRMIGAVGEDAAGRRVLKALDSAGVDTHDIQVGSASTGTALIVVDRQGENQIAVCPGANSEIDLDAVNFSRNETVLCQLEIDTEIVLDTARRTPGFFALNASPVKPLPPELLERTDLVIVNETEYGQIPELRQAKLVAVTYGGRGAALYRTGRRVASAPARRVTVVNSVGAGDAFCSALVLALRSEMSDDDSLNVACAVGAAAVQDPASQPHFEKLSTYRDR